MDNKQIDKVLDYQKLYNDLLLKYEQKEKRFLSVVKQSDRHLKTLIDLNKQLEKASNTDPMTGAYNRRYFYNTSKQMMALAKREKYDISIVMLDIDKFKNINDTYGHDIGDSIIKDLVNQINVHIRASDLSARFGGEEFVILLNNINKENTIRFCNNLRVSIQNSIPVDNISYTVSIGISEIAYNDKEDIDDTLKRADLALYEAKETGRNKVIYK
jgi:diguanylate cyclase (GGDEF)-like protein